MTGLDGRICLLTGASGGIGQALATQLAAAGADVALTYGTHRDQPGGVRRRRPLSALTRCTRKRAGTDEIAAATPGRESEEVVAKLIYSAIASLDGYVEDATGRFDWATPDEEVHAFVNDLERPIGTYLYGRRMYQTMTFWETVSTGEEQPAAVRDFTAIWRAADKIVYSRTLREVSSARTRIEPEFDPATVKRLKQAAPDDLSVGGAQLAGQALAARLVDEFHLFLFPVLVGGGKSALPRGVKGQLELRAEHRFASGVVHLHYAMRM